MQHRHPVVVTAVVVVAETRVNAVVACDAGTNVCAVRLTAAAELKAGGGSVEFRVSGVFEE